MTTSLEIKALLTQLAGALKGTGSDGEFIIHDADDALIQWALWQDGSSVRPYTLTSGQPMQQVTCKIGALTVACVRKVEEKPMPGERVNGLKAVK